MRVKYSWALVLLLSGCQLTQSENPDQASEQTNTPPTQVSQENDSPEATKEEQKDEAPVVTPQAQEDV